MEPKILFWLVTNPSDLELPILGVLVLLFMLYNLVHIVFIKIDRRKKGLQSLLLTSQSGA